MQSDFTSLYIKKPNNGNLYYVRIKTPYGIFYKLGFTTLNSVQERFSYQGNGHEEYIDVVFCFVYMDDAYEVESLLHKHFKNQAVFKLKEKNMPFYGNGQSELYSEDILNIDTRYRRSQSDEANLNIMIERMKYSNRTDEEISIAIKEQESFIKLNQLIGPKIKWLSDVYDRFYIKFLASENDRYKHNRAKECISILNSVKRVTASQDRVRKFMLESDDYSEGLELATILAFAHLMQKDLQSFEDIVDINIFSNNLAEAMNENCTMTSDYIALANNCYMLNLMNAMNGSNARYLIFRPIMDTYKAVLRHYVKNHNLLTENLIFTDDSLYCVSKDADCSNEHRWSFYSPGHYLNILGRKWSLPIAFNKKYLNNIKTWDDVILTNWDEQYKSPFTRGNGWIEFPIRVKNDLTGFEGSITIRVSRTKKMKLELSFPNFDALDEAASKKRLDYVNLLSREKSKSSYNK
jgi:hypothetical protein